MLISEESQSAKYLRK